MANQQRSFQKPQSSGVPNGSSYSMKPNFSSHPMGMNESAGPTTGDDLPIKPMKQPKNAFLTADDPGLQSNTYS